MTAHQQIYTGDEIQAHGGLRRPSEIVAEYEARRASLQEALAAHGAACDALMAATGVSGQTAHDARINVGRPSLRDLEARLLESAWRHTYATYNIEHLASASDKSRIEAMFSKPPAFALDSIREVFGDYVADPRGSILRGLAEVFSGLDPASKSHEKMKIGVKGLPKRVIISQLNSSWGYGRDRLASVVNAVAAVQGVKLAKHREIFEMIDQGDSLKEERGLWLKKYQNGNGHLYFAPNVLKAVNKGLAEFYGEVIADCPEAHPERCTGTNVAKDLAFYPTPIEAIQRLLHDVRIDCAILEPSCGDGRIMNALRADGARDVLGVEVDAGRAAQARAKGHRVVCGNFLEYPARAEFDCVVMNPPFVGMHYAKHIRHAMKMLKDGGRLHAILIPADIEHILQEAFRAVLSSQRRSADEQAREVLPRRRIGTDPGLDSADRGPALLFRPSKHGLQGREGGKDQDLPAIWEPCKARRHGEMAIERGLGPVFHT